MLLSHILSLIGCALTGLQTFLIFYQGNGLCFNEGCEIVDSLTLVPPLYFNVTGFLFFLFISFGISQARKGSEIWQRFTSLLLLAAIAAEAVLFSFQLFITDVFCSYCLIILTLIVLINIFMGLRQTFRSIVIFSTVCLAFASLDFTVNNQQEYSLKDGTLAYHSVQDAETELYLFFSSTCEHCESVIEEMSAGLSCTVNFNPVDQLESFTFPNITFSPSFEPRANVSYLKSLGIKEVPALASIKQKRITILQGEKTIRGYLQQNCMITASATVPLDQYYNQSSAHSSPLIEEDGCEVEENCEEQTSSYPAAQETSMQSTLER